MSGAGYEGARTVCSCGETRPHLHVGNERHLDATADEWTDEARGMTGLRCDTHDAHADRCTQVAVFSVEQDGETQHSCIDHVAGVLLAHSPRTPVIVRRLNHTIRGRVR